jgi:pimeloyl-ACP methyl ester carboxylesterase
MSLEPSGTSDYFYDSADGLRLYCRIYAARQRGALPLLCLPGLTRNGRDFAALAARLSERHEVLTADLRGRGRSAWDPDPAHYQLPTYLQDALSLLQSRRMNRVVIVGTSLGALMGMGLAAMRPDLIAGVVLNDAGPEFDPVGIRRIAGYAGKLPPVSSWAEAAAQAKSVYGLALPGLSDATGSIMRVSATARTRLVSRCPTWIRKSAKPSRIHRRPWPTCGRSMHRSRLYRCS